MRLVPKNMHMPLPPVAERCLEMIGRATGGPKLPQSREG